MISTTDTHGNLVQSSAPTTAPDASSKLIGDIKGAINGSVGFAEAAIGTTFKNEMLKEKGVEKMSEEDQRLAAKYSVPTVGSERRETVQERE